MSTLDEFDRAVSQAWPPERWRDVTVLVAVSGGPDSVALLRALQRLKTAGEGRLIVGHFHHRLRAEADGDQAFVVDLAQRLELAVETGAGDVAAQAEADGDGLEAAARDSRYAFLHAAAERVGARYVVTGHTRDDQVETVLHRILRGAGLAGLAGIPRARPIGHATLVRPLLEISRDQVIECLARIGQPYRVDSTNADRRLTRNRLRHELLPLLRREYNPEVDAALLRLARLADEGTALVGRQAAELCEQSTTFANDDLRFSIAALAAQPAYLVCEVIRLAWQRQGWGAQAMTAEHWTALAEMLAAPSPAPRDFPGPIRAKKTGEQLVLTRLS